MPASPLEPFLPCPDAWERFALTVRAPAGSTYAIATEFDLESIAAIRLLFRARERLLGGHRRPRPVTGLVAERLADGWGTLLERPGQVFAAGAACRPWEPEVQFRPLGPDDFAAFDAPGLVKIAWTIETTARGPDACELATETRAVATDAVARARFRRYWAWARFGVHPIRWLLLPAIRREAERSRGEADRGRGSGDAPRATARGAQARREASRLAEPGASVRLGVGRRRSPTPIDLDADRCTPSSLLTPRHMPNRFTPSIASRLLFGRLAVPAPAS